MITLSPSDAALVADVLDETLAAVPGPPSPLHARLMDICDRLRDEDEDPNPTAEACSATSRLTGPCDRGNGHPGSHHDMDGHEWEQDDPLPAEMDESLDRAATTMSMIDEATGQGRR